MNPMHRKNCFQLFGYDFLIDEDFRTWILEVNSNPYLGIPNDFINMLLPRMLNDMLRLIVDPFYPPKNPVPDIDNWYELIYCEKNSFYNDLPINSRSKFNELPYPFPKLVGRIDTMNSTHDSSCFKKKRNLNDSRLNNSMDNGELSLKNDCNTIKMKKLCKGFFCNTSLHNKPSFCFDNFGKK